jgi:hypothetical protein
MGRVVANDVLLKKNTFILMKTKKKKQKNKKNEIQQKW